MINDYYQSLKYIRFHADWREIHNVYLNVKTEITVSVPTVAVKALMLVKMGFVQQTTVSIGFLSSSPD